MRVLVIERRPAARGRALAAVVPPPFAPELCDEPEQLKRRVSDRPHAIVLPLAAGADPAVAGIIEAVRDHWPQVPVVAWCDEGAQGGAVLSAARAGVEHFAFTGVDRVEDVLRTIIAAPDESSAQSAAVGPERVRDAIDAWPPLAQRMLDRLVFAEPPITTVAELARSMQIAERTLDRRCQVRGWPSPSNLVAWGRLVRGALVVERTGDMLRGADAAGYRGVRTFRRKLSAIAGGSLTTPVGDIVGALVAMLAGAIGASAAKGAVSAQAPVVSGLSTLVATARPFTPSLAPVASTSESVRGKEHGEHRLYAARSPKIERAKPRIPFHKVAKRAG
jgi:hypothetical protein